MPGLDPGICLREACDAGWVALDPLQRIALVTARLHQPPHLASSHLGRRESLKSAADRESDGRQGMRRLFPSSRPQDGITSKIVLHIKLIH
jgi:hypothetical protein